MPIFQRIKNIFPFVSSKPAVKPVEARSTQLGTLENPTVTLQEFFSFGNSSSGVTVSEDTVKALSAVWACVKAISETIASLKLEVLEKTKDGYWIPAPNHYLYNILHLEPSKLFSAFTFEETTQYQACLRGNSYVKINRLQNGDVYDFEILPEGTKPYLSGGELWYKIPNVKLPLHYSEVIHIKALSSSGLEGINPIQAHRENFGISVASQSYGANFFDKGAHVSGALMVPGKMKQDAKNNLRDSFNRTYGGVKNTGGTVILDHGMEYKNIGLSPADALFIETRKFQTEDIARIWRMPLSMIQSGGKETYNTNEQNDIFFAKHTIRPWLKRREQEYNRKLIKPGEKGKYKIKYDINSLLRGDMKTRAEFYTALFNIRAINPNEIRQYENMKPYKGGDEFGQPLASNSKENTNDND